MNDLVKTLAIADKPIVYGPITIIFILGIAGSATAGEPVFGSLKSGLGEGIEWHQDKTRLSLKGALSLGVGFRMIKSPIEVIL